MPFSLKFNTPGGAVVPAGTPPSFCFRADGLYALGAAPDGKHLRVAPPFEVVGWDSRGGTTLRSPGAFNTVTVNHNAPTARVQRKMAQIGALPASSAAVRHLRDYLANVTRPTGSLWTVEEIAA